jgi:hypothetical protein
VIIVLLCNNEDDEVFAALVIAAETMSRQYVVDYITWYCIRNYHTYHNSYSKGNTLNHPLIIMLFDVMLGRGSILSK